MRIVYRHRRRPPRRLRVARVVERDRSATPPYDGRLDAGAAVEALECEGKTPYRRGQGAYNDGLASVQESADAALDDYMSESGLSFSRAV